MYIKRSKVRWGWYENGIMVVGGLEMMAKSWENCPID